MGAFRCFVLMRAFDNPCSKVAFCMYTVSVSRLKARFWRSLGGGDIYIEFNLTIKDEKHDIIHAVVI